MVLQLLQIAASILLAARIPESRRECISNLSTAAISTAFPIFSPANALAELSSSSSSPTVKAETSENVAFAPKEGIEVILPLEICPGGALCVRTTATGREAALSHPFFNKHLIPFRVYRLIVDTGSPYLVVSGKSNSDVIATGSFPVEGSPEGSMLNGLASGISNIDLGALLQQSLGILLPEAILPVVDDVPFHFGHSEYSQTQEIYGSQTGSMDWQTAGIQFQDRRIVTIGDDHVLVLGVMDEALTRESGGSLVGLIKHSNAASPKIESRPTFLGQLQLLADRDGRKIDISSSSVGNEVSSFKLDYPNRKLVLSTTSLITGFSTKAFPLVDLRPLGDFVEHYACKIDTIVFDGQSFDCRKLRSPTREGVKSRDIVAVFDSGLTGCLLIKPFWDRLRAEGLDPSQIESVKVRIAGFENRDARSGHLKERTRDKAIEIASSKSTNRLFYVDSVSLDWFNDADTAPYVIVLGQTFLAQGALVVDIDGRLAAFE